MYGKSISIVSSIGLLSIAAIAQSVTLKPMLPVAEQHCHEHGVMTSAPCFVFRRQVKPHLANDPVDLENDYRLVTKSLAPSNQPFSIVWVFTMTPVNWTKDNGIEGNLKGASIMLNYSPNQAATFWVSTSNGGKTFTSLHGVDRDNEILGR